MPASGACSKITLLRLRTMTPRRKANRLRPFLISKFVGALVIGSRGVCGTRTIGKQKRLPRQWKNQIPIAKGQKLPIALQRQQPTRRRDGYVKQWLNAGDKWRSLLRSRKSASQVEVERDTFEFPSAALSCFVILPLRASASCSHVSAISSNCSRCAGGDARARARHSEACCKYSSTFFTRTSPDTPQTRNVRRQERFLTKLSAFICPEDPVADAAWQPSFCRHVRRRRSPDLPRAAPRPRLQWLPQSPRTEPACKMHCSF